MLQFILNNKVVSSTEKSGSTLLDFIRYQQQLKGTKIGCREGDCGACTVLIGKLQNGKVIYQSATSCITPIGNVQGKHVVTVEGINGQNLTPYQQSMVDHSASQCGFCTVGFVMSFAGASLTNKNLTYEEVISAVDGNICRCTGYKSIERAAKEIYENLQQKDTANRLKWLIDKAYVPAYFQSIPKKLADLPKKPSPQTGKIVGGGTDLLVQKHDEIYETDIQLFSNNKALESIEQNGDEIIIGGATNTATLMESEILNVLFPKWIKHLKLVSSTPIRNIALVAGNFINASPIGDLTAIFIALNSQIELADSAGNSRLILLKDLYKGYKDLTKTDDEFIKSIRFKKPSNTQHFNFEKVSKRRYLDIASVNSGALIDVQDGQIKTIHLSAGGVGPTPKYLANTCAFLTGKETNAAHLKAAVSIMDDEISPISDARGSENYKRLLLRQLFFAHFIELFPAHIQLKQLA